MASMVAGFNELRIKDKLIKEIVIKESAKKIQVINDVGKKGIWQKTMQTIKETSIFEISKYGNQLKTVIVQKEYILQNPPQ